MGRLMWYSGVHLGTTHDVRLSRNHPPPLTAGQRLLGDKAYIGNAQIIAPIKKRRAAALSQRDAAYNVVHSWYRTSIEHCFAYLKRYVQNHYYTLENASHGMNRLLLVNASKRFLCLCRYRILSGCYRGKMPGHVKYLDRALKVIIHVSAIRAKERPPRLLVTIDGAPGPAPSPAALAAGVPAIPAAPVVVAPPPIPDVDTGVIFTDLQRGMRVKVWWIDDWWHGKIKHCSIIHQTVSVVFTGNTNCISGIKPQHVLII